MPPSPTALDRAGLRRRRHRAASLRPGLLRLQHGIAFSGDMPRFLPFYAAAFSIIFAFQKKKVGQVIISRKHCQGFGIIISQDAQAGRLCAPTRVAHALRPHICLA